MTLLIPFSRTLILNDFEHYLQTISSMYEQFNTLEFLDVNDYVA